MDRVETGAGAIAYEVHGPPGGEVVVCAHGFPDCPRTFDGIASRLAERGYRVVVPWMRGYDPSTLAGPFDGPRLAADLAALIDATSPLRPGILVGHDWGAAATYEAIATYRHRFRRAVTLALPHPAAFARSLVSSAAQLRRSWYMGLLNVPWISDRAVARRDFAFVDRLWRTWSPRYVPENGHVRALKDCLARSMPAPILYYRAIARGVVRLFREGPARIDVPTLQVHGAQDGCIDAAAGAGQERFFHGQLRSVVLPDAGHFVHLEDPERVTREILAWISSAGS